MPNSKLSFGWFKGVPGKVAHADHGESRLLHQSDILPDLFRRAIHRLVAGSDEKLSLARPIWMLICSLSQKWSAPQKRATANKIRLKAISFAEGVDVSSPCETGELLPSTTLEVVCVLGIALSFVLGVFGVSTQGTATTGERLASHDD